MIGCKSVTTYKNNSTKIQDVFNIKRDSFAKSKKSDGPKSNFGARTQTWHPTLKQTKPIHLQHMNHNVLKNMQYKAKQNKTKQCA